MRRSLLDLNIAQPITDGQLRSLSMLESTDDARNTLHLYAEFLGDYGVYLRPTDKGLTVISLEYEKCCSMIGVGDRDSEIVYLRSIPPDRGMVETAYQGYIRKRNTLDRESKEEQFVLKCIRYALANGLRLPKRELCFIHQEWRISVSGKGKKIDILAIDQETRRLVIIEAKSSRSKLNHKDKDGRNALEQAQYYADIVYRYRTALYPFFQRLAAAMTAIYNGPEALSNFTLEPDHIPETEVWFPD